MKLKKASAEIYVPDNLPIGDALARTTHLAIGAHADDLEIMALHGILECYERGDRWFCGVTVTDGARSVREGQFAKLSAQEFIAVRAHEQKEAARLGQYGAQILLGYGSAEARTPDEKDIISELSSLLQATRPKVV